MTTYGTIPTSSSPGGTSVNLEYISRAKEQFKVGLGTHHPWHEMFELHHFNLPKSVSDAGRNKHGLFPNELRDRCSPNHVPQPALAPGLANRIQRVDGDLVVPLFPSRRAVVVFGRMITDRVVLIVLAVATIVVLLLTLATSNIASALAVGIVMVIIHDAIRNTDDLSSDVEATGGNQ